MTALHEQRARSVRAGAAKVVPVARLATFRALVGGYSVVALLARVPHLVTLDDLPTSSFAPVGLARLLDRPVGDVVVLGTVAVAVATGIALMLGRGGGLLHALLATAVFGYANSFGQVFHTEHLLVLHLWVLAVAPPARSGTTAPAWPLRLAGALTVAPYVTAGLTKLRAAGLAWLDGDTLRNWVAFDNLRKHEFGDIASPIADHVVAVGWIWAPIAILTLAVELGAIIALVDRRLAQVWAAGAWLFHVGVLALMAIVFAYPLTGIAFAPFFRLERLRELRAKTLLLGPRRSAPVGPSG